MESNGEVVPTAIEFFRAVNEDFVKTPRDFQIRG